MVLASASLPGWCNPEDVYVARDELLELYSQPAWARDGLCRKYPGVNFFPELGESTAPAKAICARCAVQAECLSYALDCGPSLQGVWAGTSQMARTVLRRRRAGLVVSSGDT